MATDPFDSYSLNYESLHDRNLAPIGAESGEFLHAKLKWCARFATKHLKRTTSTRTFLDYGCGTGRLGHEFYKYFDQCWRYVGVDSSSACIKKAQEQCLLRSNLSSQLNESCFFTLEAWTQNAAQYDFILAACVFHHIEPDRRQFVLRSLWESLRQTGVIVIWEHNPWNPVTRRIVNDCPFDRDAHLLSIGEMVRLWRETIDKSEIGHQFVTFFPGILRGLQPIEHLFTRLPLGGQWVFWAQK